MRLALERKGCPYQAGTLMQVRAIVALAPLADVVHLVDLIDVFALIVPAARLVTRRQAGRAEAAVQ